MAITYSTVETLLNSYIGDSSTDRISQTERYNALSEATVWVKEEMRGDMENLTYEVEYFDSIHEYKITSEIATFLETVDLRQDYLNYTGTFTRKNFKEVYEEIGYGSYEDVYGIDRRNSDVFLVINHKPSYPSTQISRFDSLTLDGGEWEADTTNSDATNVSIDTVEFKGDVNSSLKFDADVSQSGNNKVVIINEDLNSKDLEDYINLGSWLFWVYLPENANFSSINLAWGNDSSNYYDATVTNDMFGSAFADGWQRIKIDWENATATGTPDASDITWIRFTFNYTGSYTDETGFRISDFKFARPERLQFYYTAWKIGTNSGGTDITTYSASTDIPYFSGKYDQLKYAVAHKGAAILFDILRLYDESAKHEAEAIRSVTRINKMIPSSVVTESRNFKIKGVNFTRRRF